MGKIVQLDGYKTYIKLADQKAEKGDFLGALRLLFSALNISDDYTLYADIADVYAEMGFYDFSNKYWFKYLDLAPKEKWGEVYEELAINYFYMEDLLASSYYFHKKVKIDGFISQDGLSEDIVEFLSESVDKKKFYKIVYPPEKADYSFELNTAKRALVNGDYLTAVKCYASVPKGCKQYFEAVDELSIVYFITGEVDKAIDLTKDLIKEKGETASLLCNLSSMYGYKKDADKSKYYYEKAKSIFDGEKEGLYKLSTCALEQNDTSTAVEFLAKVLFDKPNEVNMNYLYALALANAFDFEKASIYIKKVLLFKPDDAVVRYYEKVFSSKQTSNEYDAVFPLEYIDDLPSSERQKRTRRIDQLFTMETKKVEGKIKDQSVRDCLEWGIQKGKEKTVKKCIFILSQIKSEYAKKFLKNALIDPEIADETKRAIMYVLIMLGDEKSISATIKGFYMKIKPRELPCKKDPSGMIFYSGYALCLSRLIFSESSDYDKLAFGTDKVYKKLKDKQPEFEFDKESLAVLIVNESKINRDKNVAHLCELFGTKKENYQKILSLYEGENYDKNN